MKRFIKAWSERRKPPPALAEAPLCVLPAELPLAEARRVLVFAPHPDDESIGCGGAIALLAEAGRALRVVLVTDGGGAGGLPEGAAALRQQEFVAALRCLGVADHRLLGFPDGALVAEAPLLDAVRDQVADFQPDWIFGPSSADLHRDHRVVAAAVRAAARAVPGVQRVCEYETWSALPVTHVLDIGRVLDKRREALSQHRTALAHGNYLEASTGLALHRGLLLGTGRPGTAEGYVCCDRSTGFAWPVGWGRP